MSFLNNFYDKIRGLVVNEHKPSFKEIPPVDNHQEKPQYEYFVIQIINLSVNNVKTSVHKNVSVVVM
jgi:hypothetical protein